MATRSTVIISLIAIAGGTGGLVFLAARGLAGCVVPSRQTYWLITPEFGAEMVSPKLYRVVDPAAQAYSHCASVGSSRP